MGVGTSYRAPGDIVNLVAAEHGTVVGGTVDDNPALYKVGGKYVQNPTAVLSGRMAVLALSRQGFTKPELQYLLLDSQTTASGSGTGTNATGLGVYSNAQVLLDITLATGGTSTADRTLTVFLDSRLDGTSYFNLGAFSATGSVNTYVMMLSKSQSGTAPVSITADAGAGTVRALAWGDDLRVRRTVTGTSPQFTYRVWVNLVG